MIFVLVDLLVNLSPRPSPKSEVSPWRCFARTLLPLLSVAACLWPSVSEKCSTGLRSDDWLGYWRIFHFLCCFPSMFRVIIHLYSETLSYQFCGIWLNVSKDCGPLLNLVLLTSSTNPGKPVPLAGIHVHVITLSGWCLTHDVVCFEWTAVPFVLLDFVFPLFWCRFILVSSVQKNQISLFFFFQMFSGNV